MTALTFSCQDLPQTNAQSRKVPTSHSAVHLLRKLAVLQRYGNWSATGPVTFPYGHHFRGPRERVAADRIWWVYILRYGRGSGCGSARGNRRGNRRSNRHLRGCASGHTNRGAAWSVIDNSASEIPADALVRLGLGGTTFWNPTADGIVVVRAGQCGCGGQENTEGQEDGE